MAEKPRRRSRVTSGPVPLPTPVPGRGQKWPTALTHIAPNIVEVRGYPLDELMGRLTFGESIYLLLRGEVPSPSIGNLFGAVLVASLDHGVTPPSTLTALNVATTGAPLKDCVAAGILGFGARRGGDVASCLRFLQEGLGFSDKVSLDEAARQSIAPYVHRGVLPPGFGHRIHTRDPRAARLLQMAHEYDLSAEHCRFIRIAERVLSERSEQQDQPVHINLDGAIAAVCGDLGFEPEIAGGLFIIARVPGLLAHAAEEQARQPALRQIDPAEHVYDGPSRRRLPDTRR
jgi:citrate synthase